MEIRTNPKQSDAGKTILVVDDNPSIRKSLATAFLSRGFNTCGEAENGKEGIDLARQINPDIIIMDLSMPVMNGLQAASELRKIFASTPIILFTLHAEAVLQTLDPQSGVSLVLSKTVPIPALIEKAYDLMRN